MRRRHGDCFAFRAPPAYAADLRHAGFTVLNNANNHSYDFGAAGQEQTVSALHAAGIAQTGLPGEITVVRARGLRVAFVAFAPYSDTANLLDLPGGRALIQKARLQADLVVVYMHAGAEGSDAGHVTGREETYVGEDRGNPEAFAHMAIDAGADLVIASGPHVVRGMEFYHRHLIAYSLGTSPAIELRPRRPALDVMHPARDASQRRHVRRRRGSSRPSSSTRVSRRREGMP